VQGRGVGDSRMSKTYKATTSKRAGLPRAIMLATAPMELLYKHQGVLKRRNGWMKFGSV
jgi:hypothetical protein